MSLPDWNQPRGGTLHPLRGDRSLSPLLGLSQLRRRPGLWRLRGAVFQKGTLAPARDTRFFIVPLEAARSRHGKGIRGRKIKRENHEERQQQTTH